MKKFHKKPFKFQGHPIVFTILAVFSFIVLFAGSFYLYVAYLLPLPSLLTQPAVAGSIKIFDRNGQLLYEDIPSSGQKKTTVALQQIPQNFINATLAAEDINYYSHGGLDYFAIGRALFYNASEGRIVSGASTITEQLVRNLLGVSSERSYSDKILEMIYSVRLANIYSKDQILEMYLNTIYYGNLAYGSQSASLDYFGKNIYDLDLAESSLLAGLPQAPSYYNPFLYFDRAKKRQQYVLNQMVKYGFIDQQQADAAQNEPIKFRKNIVEMKAPHFVQYVLNELPNYVDEKTLQAGGLNVTTTLDYNMELQAENIISTQIKTLSAKHVTNGALLAIEPLTGKILTWVGSENYYNDAIQGQVDMITSLRQPGSSIKPLTYLMALEKGYTPATILKDVPVEFQTETGPYTPKNYDLDYHGPVRVREALASSFNIPAVETLDYVGLEPFIAFLNKVGIDTLDQDPNFYGLALTLGGGDVRIYDMARAFNMIANYGDSFDLSSIENITDANNQVLYQWQPPQKTYVLGPYGREHAYQIIDILKDPNARLKGFGPGNVLEISHDAAVKTGTTRNFRDNWTIGFTPQILTAVWVGNADASAMQNISGVDGAGPIWHDFMESVLRFAPQENFEIPPRLHQVEICALSGLLPTALCPNNIYEWFVPGSEPKQPDNYYQNYWVLRSNGHLIHQECLNTYPSSAVKQETLITYPADFQLWAAQKGLALPPYEPCALSKTSSSAYSNAYSNTEEAYVTLNNPSNQDAFSIQKSLPTQDQKIDFQVIVSPEVQKVSYVLDGQNISTQSESPFDYFWLPQTGVHNLRAIATLSDGSSQESSQVTFSVQ